MILIAIWVTKCFNLPIMVNYILVLILTIVATFMICEMIKRIKLMINKGAKK